MSDPVQPFVVTSIDYSGARKAIAQALTEHGNTIDAGDCCANAVLAALGLTVKGAPSHE